MGNYLASTHTHARTGGGGSARMIARAPTVLSDDRAYQRLSTVGQFAKSDAALEAYKTIAEMRPLDPTKLRPWTDDYSDILRPVILKYKRRFAPLERLTRWPKEDEASAWTPIAPLSELSTLSSDARPE